ncbi:MAG TPA: hypothetical protein VFZ53_09675, partial [Polyangiaceae bacterium]
VESGGTATLESVSNGWTYACEVNPSSGCSITPEEGDTVNVTGTPMPGQWTGDECTSVIGLSVGPEAQPSCWYHPCVATPP